VPALKWQNQIQQQQSAMQRLRPARAVREIKTAWVLGPRIEERAPEGAAPNETSRTRDWEEMREAERLNLLRKAEQKKEGKKQTLGARQRRKSGAVCALSDKPDKGYYARPLEKVEICNSG
jgi:hypothetical protein